MEKKQDEIKDITLTKNAAKKIIEIAKQEKKEGYALKILVSSGGCSGFQYGMDFVKEINKDDLKYEENGVKICIEKSSLEILKGINIDYIETEQESGFKIDNPNVSSGCSCGDGTC